MRSANAGRTSTVGRGSPGSVGRSTSCGCGRLRSRLCRNLILLRSDQAIAVRSRSLDTEFESLAQARGNQIGFRVIPQLLQCRGVRLFHPATQYNCRIRQFSTKASNGVAHVSRAACIQIDQADDRNAGGLKPKDIGGRKRSRLSDARRQPMCRAELSEHDRGRFIDQTTSGHAENGMVTLPFRR